MRPGSFAVLAVRLVEVTKNTKAPLVVTLHGPHTTMLRPNIIDLAEADSILLAPIGYTRAAGTARRRRRDVADAGASGRLGGLSL